MAEKKLEVKQILTGKADVILANALTWLEKRGGRSVLQDMKKMKTHAGVALSMFSETRDVAQCPIVQAIVKRLNLDNEQKSKYQSVWNLSQLTRFILREGLGEGRVLMQKTMGLIVAFSATRMVELAAIVRKNIEIDQQQMRIKTVVKKRKKPKEFVITFMRRQSICCPVAAMEKWLNAKECTKEMNEGIWLDYDKGRILGGIGCSKELRKLLDDIGVDQEFAGSSVRHAMMTKMRKEGATQEEVNEATRHAPGSNACDIFYNKPMTRDLGALILKDSEDNVVYGLGQTHLLGLTLNQYEIILNTETPQAQVPRLARLVAVRLVNLKRKNEKCAMKKQ
ncbi:MAG: hypothetical protein EZS28_011609 [Streblomastix strix]|uniref:Tyr recombinase domain-containing protein n=1 Tax=Streblomastix strix TaxID=222440 RepID=A0A5J4WEQ2_9EUKA|nr:MAG: hypothetical protein EZS28_011609 [Streblomastix strix]